MARDLTRTKPVMTDELTSGGLEEFAPRARNSGSGEEEMAVAAGWSIDRRPLAKGDRPNRLAVPDGGEEILIKFLEEAPFASFFQHWVKTDRGRRPYICLGGNAGGKKICPLCAYSDTPKPQDWFNVIEMDSAEGKHALKLWQCSADPAKSVRERATNKRTSPINRENLYFAVSKREAANGFNTYTLDPVKSDELEDWGVVALTPEKIREFEAKMHTRDLVKLPTKAELQEVADEYFKD